MTKENCGWQAVQGGLDCFIELLFQISEAYHLAMKLYAGCYEVFAGRDIANSL
jgi:hypothetical protein